MPSCLLACLLAFAARAAEVPRPWADRSLSPDARAGLVLKAMSQDEKFQLVRSQFGDRYAGRPAPAGAKGSAGYMPALARLGLPAIQETDAGLGVTRPGAAGGATPLPAGLATAASFDPAIAYAGGAMIGDEARRRGFGVLLAGGANLARDPRNGRNFEYLGEDPLLAGTLAGQAIRGVQSRHVVATLKHYALNDLETGRTVHSADLGERAMRESDLLAFEIALGVGDPGAVMCAYNKVNGTYACENGYLLDQVLKRDWGFPGYVMSDWGAVHSAAPAALAGLDQESAGETFDSQVFFDAPLRRAVAAGQVSQARLDDMVRRILRTLFAKGVYDDPPREQPVDYAAHAEVAQRVEEAGAVLLRNARGTLPLDGKLRAIAVIGAHADAGVLAGGGSSATRSPAGNPVPGLAPTTWPGPVIYHASSPLAAIRAHAPAARVDYADGKDPAAAAALAKRADVAVVFVQQWLGESFDAPDLRLPDNQDALVEAVAAANPRTVVVLETGGPVALPWLGRVGAVLAAWYPGGRGGEAIARLLFGDVAPSGRLPLSWPASAAQLPRPRIEGAGLGNPARPAEHVDYTIEGADVGYRWYQRQGTKPLFAFGYGLGYTRFAYGDFRAEAKGGALRVSFTVRNTGRRAGADVPQVYVSLPGRARPRRLAAWTRLTLKPGESRRVALTAEPRLLADFDVATQRWRRPAGAFTAYLARSAEDVASQATVTLPAETLPAAH
jgi:beta-glucosidase